jgi:hypothetical protein
VMAVYQQDRQPRFYLKFFPNFPQFPIDWTRDPTSQMSGVNSPQLLHKVM